jgi:L-amino acid N-acyltransferase YncA
LYYAKSRLRDVLPSEILLSFLCLCHTDPYFTLVWAGSLMKIDKSNAADIPEILSILNASKGDNLTAQQREQEGFTQGTMDAAMLNKFQTGSGVFVSREQRAGQDVICGVAMTAPGSLTKHGTAQAAYQTVLESGFAKAEQIFLYGPVSVRKEFRGKGILTQLLLHICRTLQKDFTLGVAFVDKENHKSLLIHRHYPMDEAGEFELNGRGYVIFTFEPLRVQAFYQHPE